MAERRRDRLARIGLPLRWLALGARALLGAPGRAVKGTARVVADPARQVVDYWRSERSTIRQGFVANSISALTSLIAGLALAGMAGRIVDIKGLFVLIPVSIGMRGNIFGALAARLGTSIHSGLFEVSARRDKPLFQNVYATTLLTIATSVTMGLLARAIAGLLGIETVSAWDLVVVALVGGLLSSVFVLGFTVLLSVVSFRRGWDLDSVGATLITTVGDVVTLPMLFAASYLVGIPGFTPVAGALALLAGAIALVHGSTVTLPLARRIVRESFPVLTLAMVLDILAGTVVEPRVEHVFEPYPALLILLPGFLENTGALGSILAARLGTKLHLGVVSPATKPEPAALLDGTIVLLLGVTIYSISALSTLVVAAAVGAAYPGAWTFLGATMAGGLLAVAVASVIGYYAAVFTFRLRLDPDNHTVPLVTSGMDLLGAICLVAALVIFGVA